MDDPLCVSSSEQRMNLVSFVVVWSIGQCPNLVLRVHGEHWTLSELGQFCCCLGYWAMSEPSFEGTWRALDIG